MPSRYFFLCPDSSKASGGIAVIYDTVVALRRAGYDAAVVHSSPDAGYPDYAEAPPLFYTDRARRAQIPNLGRLGRQRERIRLMRDRMVGKGLPKLDLQPTDVIIVPEFMLVNAIEGFPDQRIGVFVQNPFTFGPAYVDAIARNLDPARRISWFIGIADICMRQFELFMLPRTYYMPVSMKPDDFPFAAEKEALITYMPRKRPWEAQVIDGSLRARARIGGYRLEAIDGLPRAEVARKLAQSRFFISLLKTEALGFPAAEAMAAGCVTIGFTGLGTEEYFNAETGIPVPEGDLHALVEAVEAAVAEYETDPTRLDALRSHASAFVREKYSRAAFETALLRIWQDIEAG